MLKNMPQNMLLMALIGLILAICGGSVWGFALNWPLFWPLLLLVALGLAVWGWLRQKNALLFLQFFTLTVVFLVAQAYGQQALQQALQARLAHPISVRAVVQVDGLSDGVGAHWQQVVRVERVDAEHASWLGRRWLLRQPFAHQLPIDDGLSTDAVINMQAGQRWSVQVKLKPIRGQASPNAFDVERWMLSRGIVAQGEIVQAKRLPALDSLSLQDRIDRLRLRLRVHLSAFDAPENGVLLGLLTGDRALLDGDIKARYQQVGISHLLAISGPHVLMLAVMLTGALALLLNRWPRLYLYQERRRWLLPFFVLCVLAYALLAGFELPAQRTFFMVLVVALAQGWRRVLPFSPLLLAALLVLLVDPLAVLSAAFVLSFAAVWILSAWTTQQASPATPSGWRRVFAPMLLLIRQQAALTVLLIPLILAVFGQLSWWSFPVNLIAIPLLGVLVLGVNLLALLLWPFSVSAADLLWQFNLDILSYFHQFIDFLLNKNGYALWPYQLSLLQLFALLLLLFLLLLPRGLLSRAVLFCCAVLCLFALCWPSLRPVQTQAPLTVQVLDVGGGQSLLLRTARHNLLLDVGSKAPLQQQGMAERVLLPMLYTQHIRVLDALILTRTEPQYSAGLGAVLGAVQVKKILTNQVIPQFDAAVSAQNIRVEGCVAGQQWTWDGVDFAVLSPYADAWDEAAWQNLAAEDQACVLLVTVPVNAKSNAKGQAKDDTKDDTKDKRQRVLIMSDASRLTEQMLLLLCQDVRADVLIVAQHGAKNSNSMAFLQAVGAKRAVISVDEMQGKHAPDAQVLARFKQLGMTIDNTADGGTLSYRLGVDDDLSPQRWRDRWPWLH